MGLSEILTNMRDSGYFAIEKGRLIGRAHTERTLMKNRTTQDVLTKEQKRAAKEFWSVYFTHPHLLAHKYYTEKTDQFFPEYIPSDLYYTKIDTYFNDWQQARVLDNKLMHSIS